MPSQTSALLNSDLVGMKKPSFLSWDGGKGEGPLEHADVMMWMRLQQQQRMRNPVWPGPQESPPETQQSLNGIQQEGQLLGQSPGRGPGAAEIGGLSEGMLEKEDAEAEMKWTHCWTLLETKTTQPGEVGCK